MLTQYQLKNKMKVLLLESHKAPVVAVQVWVKTGSADEKKREEGISHFIEHLVFKGTQKYGVGEIAKVVEGSGGELNAFTTFDHTVFHVTMSKDDLEVGLDTLSEMMGSPKFDPVEIDREREVVIEEIKRSFDNPHQVASQQLFSTVFKKHPYGIPIIGYERNIREVSRKKLLQYYHSRYVPSNMTLVVAGDFDHAEIKKKISEYYEFPKEKLKKIKRVKEPKQKKIHYNYKTTEFKDAALNLAFKVPGAKHKDVPVIDVLSLILAMGDSSRLMQKLRLEKPLVKNISAGSFNPLDGGLFDINANFKLENVREIMETICDEVVKILSQPVSDEELERVKTNLQSDEVYSLETVDGLARKVGTFQTLISNPRYIEKYLKQIHALTPKDILVAARKYINPATMSLTLLLNKKDEMQFTQKDFFEVGHDIAKRIKAAKKVKLKAKFKKKRSPDIKIPLKLRASQSEIKKYDLSTGARLILKQNKEVPVITMKAGFLGALRLENDGNRGITTLLSNSWTGGTKTRTEEEIAAEIENSAASLSAFGGRNTVGMSFDTLKGYLGKTKEIFSDVLVNPNFPQQVISREAHIQKEHILSRADNPSNVAVLKFMENIFAGHPYSHDLLGSPDFLSHATASQVTKFYEEMVVAKNGVFVATGDFEERTMIEFFENLSKQLPAGVKHAEVFQPAPLEQDKKIFSQLDKEQTHIILGYRGLSLKDHRRYALQIVQAILAGQGGRLFVELRDKASLAYTVAPIHMDGMETGYFGGYIGCSPEKGTKAIEMLNIEFQKLVEKAPTVEEIDRAKKYLVGQNHIGLQRNSSQANSILFDEVYGIDSRETFQFAEHIKHVTEKDVHRLCCDLFQAPAITVAVGPKSPWNDL